MITIYRSIISPNMLVFYLFIFLLDLGNTVSNLFAQILLYDRILYFLYQISSLLFLIL